MRKIIVAILFVGLLVKILFFTERKEYKLSPPTVKIATSTPTTKPPSISTATTTTISTATIAVEIVVITPVETEPIGETVELGPPDGMFGPPSLWPDDIDGILNQRGSPAWGNGRAFWNLGVQYGIDPAYLLAFFAKESSMGTDPNWRQTNNIGNIICTENWNGACSGRFRVYETWEQAAEDWYSLMARKYAGQDIYSIMYKYAPIEDGNNPDKYARTVLQLVEQWRTR